MDINEITYQIRGAVAEIYEFIKHYLTKLPYKVNLYYGKAKTAL